MAKTIYRWSHYIVTKTYTVVNIKTRGHTHMDTYAGARMIISFIRQQKVPKKSCKWVLVGLIRVSEGKYKKLVEREYAKRFGS